MVKAEVPFWVVHQNASYAAATGSTINTSSGNGEKNQTKAQTSLSLLDSSLASKCAIYSVDVHPTDPKFATGGGDGTVRIWNMSCLFGKHNKGGRFVSNKVYESSDSSGPEPETDVETTEDDNVASKEAGEEAPPPVVEETVHDLTQLVRRKNKNGKTPAAAATPIKAAPKVVAPTATTLPSSPTKSSKHQRLLCTLTNHSGSSVLAVRFSRKGTYLASAGDDAAVCVYTRSNTSGGGGNLEQNVEHWSSIKVCRGHTLDVVGLTWSPDDSYLVSCSLDADAPICVWKLKDSTSSGVLCHTPFQVLGKGVHTSTVKGITFDPAGSYLASSGDDPAVCIWRAHDDWGLEKRIDASDGIFRKWKEQDVQELSGQTMFRRLSWSTDGAYICSTNGLVQNRHVASTISRDGWTVTSAKSAGSGAANLVGHKHPVVASRHCPYLLDSRKEGDDEDDADGEIEHSTLVALGDKRGFLSVWSTRKSRPIFKLQCSENRCTVTDLAWGRAKDNLLLFVTLLDGNMVVLNFTVPSEIGPLLSEEDQKRVFQLRYGIDADGSRGFQFGSAYGNTSGPKFIENALQFTLEQEDDQMDVDTEDDTALSPAAKPMNSTQTESRVKGKKRIRPILMQVESSDQPSAKKNPKADKSTKKTDMVSDALKAAEEVAAVAEGTLSKSPRKPATPSRGTHANSTQPQQQQHVAVHSNQQLASTKLPYSSARVHSVALPTVGERDSTDPGIKIVASCTNSNRLLPGSTGKPLPCVEVLISKAGTSTWKDDISGTSCSAVAADRMILAVGTNDGCLYLYSTSPTSGWTSGTAFRSHPPLIFGNAIVALQMRRVKNADTEDQQVELVVVSADGNFGVYKIMPSLELLYKGSILSALSHMMLASSESNSDVYFPKLARIQVTDSGHLLMILSLKGETSSVSQTVGPGGSLQGFLYDRKMELWMRISDSRFILSDYYSPLSSTDRGLLLAKMDDTVRSGATLSAIRPANKRDTAAASAGIYSKNNNISITRAHCEDRMACSILVESAKEFQFWLSRYVKSLAMGGDESQLRTLLDMLLAAGDSASTSCWWLSSAPTILGLARQKLVKDVVLPEMSKNRSLQRLTNEVSVELGNV